VPLPALTVLSLDGELASVIARVPAGPGVGQVRGPEGRNLVLAPTPNLRKWVASRLGLGPPAAPGRRPKTDLSSVATAVAWARTDGPFTQRLLYERLAAPLVPLAERRDLKPPVFLHIDPGERFPRLTVSTGVGPAAGRHGPFPHRRAAEKARDAVNRRFGLRPCDFVFEPDPALPLGLGCLYAQVRSCAAPCLARLSEDGYRALAARAAGWLADPGARLDDPDVVPSVVSAVAAGRAVVVDAGRRHVGLYPVREGRVLDEAGVVVGPAGLDDAVRGLEWPPGGGADDWPWLARWIAGPKGRGSYLPVGGRRGPGGLVAAVRSSLPARFAAPAGGDNVGVSQGEA